MKLITKIRHKLARQQCPKCRSYKIIKGTGWAGLKCITCKQEYELRTPDGLADAPQVDGHNTIYEEYINALEVRK